MHRPPGLSWCKIVTCAEDGAGTTAEDGGLSKFCRFPSAGPPGLSWCKIVTCAEDGAGTTAEDGGLSKFCRFPSAGPSTLAMQDVASDDHALDFTGTLADGHQAGVPVDARDRVVARGTGSGQML